MIEPLITLLALIFALIVVLLIHRQISGDIRITSANKKTILAMDGVAIAVLFAGFMLGEVSMFSEAIRDKSRAVKMALTWHDICLVLGTLLGSLLIYVAVDKLQKPDRNSRRDDSHFIYVAVERKEGKEKEK